MYIADGLDLTLPLTDVAVEVLVALLLAIGGAGWSWWRWGPTKRRDLTTPDRHQLALKLGAAARQLEVLALYDGQLSVPADIDSLWPKMQRCLDNLTDIGHGSAAKIATGNSAGGLSKSEGEVAMLMVGTISNLAMSYAQDLQRRASDERSKEGALPDCHLGLHAWAELLWFAEKVFDPTRRTPWGTRRLERRLRTQIIDMYQATNGSQPSAASPSG